MSRNYQGIHYIQERLKEFNSQFVECVIRQFNLIESYKESDGCLSNSIILYICAKEYDYKPKLCYGLCSYENHQFYHAWLEINDIIIDLSIYGNVNYNPYFTFQNKLDTPYIGVYENNDIYYGRFEFDEDWSSSLISKMEGVTFINYMDGLPQNKMWKLLCRILDTTLSKDLVNHFKSLIKNNIIKRD